MENKVCKKCNESKPLTEFYFRKDSGKHRNHCISCEKNRVEKYYSENSEARKNYQTQYYTENKEQFDEKYSNYRLTTMRKTYTKKYNKLYRIKNKDKLLYDYREKKKTNSLFKLKENIRSLISIYFKKKGFKKNSKTAQILGCSYEKFKLHLEKQFEPWMNWQNHGKYNPAGEKTWQLDHIIPVSKATSIEELTKLNHYSNFQPLESGENNAKSNKAIQNQDRTASLLSALV